MRNTILILAFFLMAGCAMTKKARSTKRIQRIAHRADLVRLDTIEIESRLIWPGVRIDTTIRKQDSISIQNDSAKILIRTIRDSVNVFVECYPDTVYQKEFYPVEKIVLEENDFTSISWMLAILLLITLFLSFKFKRK